MQALLPVPAVCLQLATVVHVVLQLAALHFCEVLVEPVPVRSQAPSAQF